jgi:glycosyltransferase involved in cell wall biosynthesis
MLSMRIGIDYTAAVRQGAGIGRYTRQLVHALVALDSKNQYVLLAAGGGSGGVPGSQGAERALGSGRGASGVAARGNVHSVTLPVSDRAMATLWHRLRLPLPVELFCGALDLFHSPDFTLPPVRRARTVLTVHDLSFMRVPQCSDPRLRSYLLQAVPTSVRRADVVLADSECTRADVIELLGVDPAHVEVIYPGVEPRFRPVQDTHTLDAVRSRYRLPARFVLGLGTLQPRKNFERLIEACAQLKEEARSGMRLVIGGGTGWMYEGIFGRVEELGVQGAVCFPGYVADEDLPALYTLADLFVFPSLYEGFGLPPLEAMACGTPVVTSHASSLPEVVGDAALMVDPLDVAALSEAIQRVLSDTDLRHRMIRQGQEQARRFTWPRAAQKLLGLYERIVSSRYG